MIPCAEGALSSIRSHSVQCLVTVSGETGGRYASLGLSPEGMRILGDEFGSNLICQCILVMSAECSTVGQSSV